MIRLNTFLRSFFAMKERNQTAIIDHLTEQEDSLEQSFVVIATKTEEEDYVMIKHDEYKPELAIQKSIEECELLAKKEVYRLGIPVDAHPDKALAAQQRLENQGFELRHLSADDLQQKGVFIYALVNKNDPQAPITVLCRGTAIDASLIADLDPNGPGSTVMKQNREQLLKSLDTLCQQYPNKKIRITGHSLGGALSQILMTDLLKEKHAFDSTYLGLKQITGIDTVVFQSAGVSTDCANEATELAGMIKSIDQNFEMNFVAHVKEGDFVSRTSNYLFSDINSNVVNVSLILRNLDKPMLSLGDCLDIGFTGATTANPLLTAFSASKKILFRGLKNRIDAHTDLFHHDAKDDLLSPKSYGFLSNANPEDRDLIKKTFTAELTMNLPILVDTQTAVHGLISQLNNQEVDGIVNSVNAVATIAGTMADLATAPSSMKAGMICMKQANACAKAVENLNNYGRLALDVMVRLYHQVFTPEIDKSNQSCVP